MFKISSVVYQGPSLFAALLAAAKTTMFGLWIILPWSAFAFRPTYAFMAAIMPELVWGSIFLIIGTARIFAICTNNYRLVKISTFFSFLVWVVVAICFTVAGWQAPAFIIGWYLAIQAGHHYIMAKQPKNLHNKTS